MWKNYLKSAVRVIIMLPWIVLDIMGSVAALLWMIMRVITLWFCKRLAKIIPLSKDCPYVKSVDKYISELKEAHQGMFVDILDILL